MTNNCNKCNFCFEKVYLLSHWISLVCGFALVDACKAFVQMCVRIIFFRLGLLCANNMRRVQIVRVMGLLFAYKMSHLIDI